LGRNRVISTPSGPAGARRPCTKKGDPCVCSLAAHRPPCLACSLVGRCVRQCARRPAAPRPLARGRRVRQRPPRPAAPCPLTRRPLRPPACSPASRSLPVSLALCLFRCPRRPCAGLTAASAPPPREPHLRAHRPAAPRLVSPRQAGAGEEQGSPSPPYGRLEQGPPSPRVLPAAR
jgi:hypothetical protein